MFKCILRMACVVLVACAPASAFEKSLDAAYKPTFVSSEGSRKAGTAFVLKYYDTYLAVTAHHLFGPAGGFRRKYKWNEISTLVSSVRLHSLSGNGERFKASEVIPINGAMSVSRGVGKNDIAVFTLDQTPSSYLEMADSQPNVGDTVWLYAFVSNRSKTMLFHEATVISYDQNKLTYRFKDSGLRLNGTSGAAVLNQYGSVVGINLTAGVHDGKLYGNGNPLSSIQHILSMHVQ